MEMTMDIDESIKELSKWRKDLNYDRGDYCYGGTTTKHSLDVAINTMRKYQKIMQIAREGINETRCEEIVRIIDGNVN